MIRLALYVLPLAVAAVVVIYAVTLLLFTVGPSLERIGG